jgi:hypothetical protein
VLSTPVGYEPYHLFAQGEYRSKASRRKKREIAAGALVRPRNEFFKTLDLNDRTDDHVERKFVPLEDRICVNTTDDLLNL